MGSGLKKFLHGLAQSGSDPVGTAMNAYKLALTRKQKLIENDLAKRAMGLREGELGARGRELDLRERVADPEYIRNVNTIKEKLKRDTAAEKDAGFYGLGATTAPVSEDVELPGPPQLDPELGLIPPTQQIMRPPNDQEKRNWLGAAYAGRELIDVKSARMKEQNKAQVQLDKARTMMREKLHPSMALFDERMSKIPATDRARILQRNIQLGETQEYPGAPKQRDPTGLAQVEEMLRVGGGGAPKQQFAPPAQPGAEQPQMQLQTPTLPAFQRIMREPVARSAWFRMAPPELLRSMESVLEQMLLSGQLSPEEEAIINERLGE